MQCNVYQNIMCQWRRRGWKERKGGEEECVGSEKQGPNFHRLGETDQKSNKNGIKFEDNYSFRQALQKKGPEFLSKLQEQSRSSCDPCNQYTDMSATY